MGDIFVPRVLTDIESVIKFLTPISKQISDPKEREKIADDIKAFHALNEIEFKKSSDARDLIKRHSDILTETKKTEDNIAKQRGELANEKEQFNTEKEAEKAKINLEKSNVKEALEKAQDLHKQAVEIRDKAIAKESFLTKEKEAHEANVRAHIAEKESLENQRKEIENYKSQVLALDAQTKAKVEALKKFNF